MTVACAILHKLKGKRALHVNHDMDGLIDSFIISYTCCAWGTKSIRLTDWPSPK